jgi:hypothetical protein
MLCGHKSKWGSSSCIVSGLLDRLPGLESSKGSGFSSSIMSILVLLYFKGHQQCVLQKWAGYEFNHSSLCSAKVKNVWLCSAALLYVLITRHVKAQQQLFTFSFCLLTFAFLLRLNKYCIVREEYYWDENEWDIIYGTHVSALTWHFDK